MFQVIPATTAGGDPTVIQLADLADVQDSSTLRYFASIDGPHVRNGHSATIRKNGRTLHLNPLTLGAPADSPGPDDGVT